MTFQPPAVPQLVTNTHDQLKAAMAAGHPHPFAIGAYLLGARDRHFYAWEVRHLAIRTDPSQKPVDWPHGHKQFSLLIKDGDTRAERKTAALARAKEWVAKTYGYQGAWLRNGMGDHLPSDIARAFPLKRDRRTPAADRVYWMGSHLLAGMPPEHRAKHGINHADVVVRCSSKKRLAEILGVSMHHLTAFREPMEVDADHRPELLAVAVKPGVIYYNPKGDGRNGSGIDAWFELPAARQHSPFR